MSDQLWSVSMSGDAGPRADGIDLAALTENRNILRMWPANGGAFLLLNDNYFVILDESRREETAAGNLRQNPDGRPSGIKSLREIAVRGDEILGIGSLAEGGWGVFSTRLTPAAPRRGSGPVTLQPARKLADIDESMLRYTYFGHTYLAANGNGLFAIVMRNGRAGLWRLDRGNWRELESFPAEFANVPPLDQPLSGPSDSARALEWMEGQKMPVGLFSGDRFLYLLTREPRNHQTLWRLHRIDPENDRYLGSVKLPTRAHHLNVIPGPSHWFFIERGKMDNSGDQPIASILGLPRPWIDRDHQVNLDQISSGALRCPSQRPRG